MKILLIHADLIEYEVTKPSKVAEPNPKKHGKKENVLVAFVCVEPGDIDKIDRAVEAIEEVKAWVKAPEVFIYPYAHLSENLAEPEEALEVLNKLAEKIKAERAPFGWYKRFKLHAKGHALAELSRRI